MPGCSRSPGDHGCNSGPLNTDRPELQPFISSIVGWRRAAAAPLPGCWCCRAALRRPRWSGFDEVEQVGVELVFPGGGLGQAVRGAGVDLQGCVLDDL